MGPNPRVPPGGLDIGLDVHRHTLAYSGRSGRYGCVVACVFAWGRVCLRAPGQSSNFSPCLLDSYLTFVHCTGFVLPSLSGQYTLTPYMLYTYSYCTGCTDLKRYCTPYIYITLFIPLCFILLLIYLLI